METAALFGGGKGDLAVPLEGGFFANFYSSIVLNGGYMIGAKFGAFFDHPIETLAFGYTDGQDEASGVFGRDDFFIEQPDDCMLAIDFFNCRVCQKSFAIKDLYAIADPQAQDPA